MKALKFLVLAMAALIVVGIAVLAWGIVHKARRLHAGAERPPSVATAIEPGGYFTADVEAPPGMHLEQMAVAGERVLLRYVGPDGGRIVVLDPRNGRIAGTIALEPSHDEGAAVKAPR